MERAGNHSIASPCSFYNIVVLPYQRMMSLTGRIDEAVTT